MRSAVRRATAAAILYPLRRSAHELQQAAVDADRRLVLWRIAYPAPPDPKETSMTQPDPIEAYLRKACAQMAVLDSVGDWLDDATNFEAMRKYATAHGLDAGSTYGPTINMTEAIRRTAQRLNQAKGFLAELISETRRFHDRATASTHYRV